MQIMCKMPLTRNLGALHIRLPACDGNIVSYKLPYSIGEPFVLCLEQYLVTLLGSYKVCHVTRYAAPSFLFLQ